MRTARKINRQKTSGFLIWSFLYRLYQHTSDHCGAVSKVQTTICSSSNLTMYHAELRINSNKLRSDAFVSLLPHSTHAFKSLAIIFGLRPLVCKTRLSSMSSNSIFDEAYTLRYTHEDRLFSPI